MDTCIVIALIRLPFVFTRAKSLMCRNAVKEWSPCSHLRQQLVMAARGTFVLARVQETNLHMQGGLVPMKAKAIAIAASALKRSTFRCLSLLCGTGDGGVVPEDGL